MGNSNTDIPKRIVWLASYPKSGNTWCRAFLSALLNNGELDINALKIDGIYSSRSVFDMHTDLDSTYLYDDEVKIMLPDVYKHVAMQAYDLLFIKVHDAFHQNKNKELIIPEEATKCAVYFIRNPLDIAGSLANHNQRSIQEEVDFITDSSASFAIQKNNLNKSIQTSQFLSDWSGHVISWTTLPSFPVLIIRYEDMISNSFISFKKICAHIGFDKYSDDEILKAINACDFTRLNELEAKHGFIEKPSFNSPSFFRKGTLNNWTTELNAAQIEKITKHHDRIMTCYNYL